MSSSGDIGRVGQGVWGRAGLASCGFGVANDHVAVHAAWGQPVMLRQDSALRSESSTEAKPTALWTDLVQQEVRLVFPSVHSYTM